MGNAMVFLAGCAAFLLRGHRCARRTGRLENGSA